CIRCFACMVSCSTENRLRLQREDNVGMEKSVQHRLAHQNHLTPIRKEFGIFPNSRQVTAFHHCNHCELSPCLDICPVDAITRRPGGEVVINQDPCIGCSSCVDACPFDVPVVTDGKAYKCHGCYDRVENGLKPACANICPTDAMFSGTVEYVLEEANRRADFYTATTGVKHIVYGEKEVNSYVGKLNWVTIIPEEDLKEYQLDTDPTRPVMQAREVAKVGGAVAAVAIGVGSVGHLIYWLSKRKDKIKQEGQDHE
ncbi:MAG: formate dehydrogenase iron-sulfur subunit, partial [Sulfurimonas sp.]